MKKRIIVLAGILAVIATASVLWAKSSPHESDDQHPTVTWSANEIKQSLAPGENKTVVVTFRSRVNLSKIMILASSSLDDVVSINPASFSSISANRTYQISITFKAPKQSRREEYNGIVELRDAPKHGEKEEGCGYEEPLKVELEIEKPAPTIGTPVANPAVIGVNTPTTVTVIAVITDPSVIPGSVTLLRLNSTGASTTLGQLHDDGRNGDDVAGDKTFTIQLSLNEAAMGQIRMQVSAMFRGVTKRMLSSIVTVEVEPIFYNQSLGVTFNYPNNWMVATTEAGEVTVSNVDLATLPVSESLSGICKISFNSVRKPAGQMLLDWLNQMEEINGDLPPISLSPITIGGLGGLREISGEVGITDTVYLPASNVAVLSIGLVCGTNMQTSGTMVFNQILTTIRIQQ